MRLYLIALQFLTIIPLPFSVRCEERDLGRAMALFPLAGLTIGGILTGADYILALRLPRPLVDLLLVAILAVLTGVLHLDGLADCCDGLAARGGRERFLAVMKDSRIGAGGVVGLVLALLIKYQALLLIPLAHKREVLFLFPLMARFSQTQMAVGAERARPDGLGSVFIAGVGGWQLAVAAIMTAVFAWLLSGLRGVACALILFLFTWGAKKRLHRKLGGITGDVIGCVSELNEILCLVIMLVLLQP